MEKGDDPSGGFLLWFAKWRSHSLVVQVLLWCVSRDRLSVWLPVVKPGWKHPAQPRLLAPSRAGGWKQILVSEGPGTVPRWAGEPVGGWLLPAGGWRCRRGGMAERSRAKCTNGLISPSVKGKA